jgi:hypothetical protein
MTFVIGKMTRIIVVPVLRIIVAGDAGAGATVRFAPRG